MKRFCFNFEKNLDHQTIAVNSTVEVFECFDVISPSGVNSQYENTELDYKHRNFFKYSDKIRTIQHDNGVAIKDHRIVNSDSNVIDIMMETGTGKTYTYTKTMFELNKQYGIFKFIVIVPTLSIKAGTVDFLKSAGSREHFKEQYGKTINLHIVESQKATKSKKTYFPPAVLSFVKSESFDKNHIQVMVINAGMINSNTMDKDFDVNLFDKCNKPFEAIAQTKPFIIIDEPHKFKEDNKTWKNIQKLKPQFILRYGATFESYYNLVYTLTAVDSFNRNLVKGVIGYITEFEQGNNVSVKFVSSNGREAKFELIENSNHNSVNIAKKECMERIHSAMKDLTIDDLNKSTVVLSNGLELKKGETINPYSYSETLQEVMIRKAIHQHFELEKQLLQRDVRIKPLTLFFIDNIEESR